MKKISILVLALFLLFGVGFQAYAEDISADTTTVQRNNAPMSNNGDVGARGGVGNRGTVGGQMDRTNMTRMDNSRLGGGGVNTPGMRGTGGVGGFDNNMRANNTTNNNGWGWLGILGLLGLAGMFGRNRNPER